MKTRITELLGCQYPVIQGGMAWIAEHTLAAAVSNAGGVGLIAGGNAPIDYLREQIRLCKEKTDKPFGVNIMLMSPNADDLAQLCIDEKVAVVTTGAGNPGKYIPAWKETGIKVIPVIPSVALAKRMERAGADAVVAEGTESGGHIGEITTMCLVPQVVDTLEIPVIAAGGIADGRGVAASFMLTRPLVSVFARPDNPVYDLAVTGNRICTAALFFIGFNIFASGMFTALSNGIVSAVLAFSRSFVFMLITMIVLPLLLGVNGIWLATPAAELMALVLSIFMFLKSRKRYGY